VSGLRSAITFLTRLPIGDGSRPNIDAAPAWFPIVGLGLGGGVGGVFAGASWLAGPLVGAAVAIAAGALVTGAFHQDGLADTADAFGGGWTVEQRISIFKDSRHGTYGVMALISTVLLQVAALASLSPRNGFFALVAAHSLGRCGAVALMLVMRPARADGLGARYAKRLPRSGAFAGVAVPVVVVLAATGGAGVVLIGGAVLCTALVGWLSRRKIGGIVGDVLGATEQMVETAILLAAASLVHHSLFL
jgi:adenosylcobinamide-GDP ribazoletransferase